MRMLVTAEPALLTPHSITSSSVASAAPRLRPAGAAPGGFLALQTTDDTDAANPLRTFSFYLALAFVFVKFGLVQEIQAQTMGFNAKLVYVLGIPCILGVVLGGGISRLVSVRTGIYWLAYGLWFCLGTPFSTWRGGSITALSDFLRADLIMLFVVGGLVTNWAECKKIAAAIGLAGILNVISGKIFAGDMSGRYGLEFGSVSNPNDYAAHLILVLPFVLYLAVSRRNFLVRAAAAVAACVGVYFALKTASRGAEVALVVDAVIFLVAGNMKRRLSVVCLAPAAALALILLLPGNVLLRLQSLTASEDDNSVEAVEAAGSSDARAYVLRKSLEYMIQFPIFGLGMAQFPVYEGGHNATIGTHGYWHETHNSYTQAGSEGGVLAGTLLIAAWSSALLVFFKTNRQARARPDCRDIELVTFYAMVGVGGFIVAITFLNFAYLFYGPAIGGLAVAVKRAATKEMAARSARNQSAEAATPQPYWPVAKPSPLRAR